MTDRPGRPSWRASLRTRLVLWFGAVLTATLFVFAVLLYASVRHGLWREFDLRLLHEAESDRGLLAPYWTIDGLSEPGFINPIGEGDSRWLEVWSPEGAVLFQSPAAEGRPFTSLPIPTGAAVRSFRSADGERLRALDAETDIIGLPVVLRAVQSEERVHGELRTIAWSMVAGFCLCVGLAVWGGHRIARRALRPMEHLVDEAAAITVDRLEHPLTIERADDEVGRLAAAFNETLLRLNVSFEQARRFSADASHELRTPVTTIRTVGQVALQQAGDDPVRLRDALASIVEEGERLTRLLDTLLLLSRGDAGQVEMHRRAVDVAALVGEVATQCEVLAEEKAQALDLELQPAYLEADPGLLRIAIANVIDNAIRYTPARGRVVVRVEPVDGHVRVAVTDSGPGIAERHHARLFDRFYRVDRDRSRQSGGMGLGLSIAHWAVTLHGGRIIVESRPGEGSTFRIELPAI